MDLHEGSTDRLLQALAKVGLALRTQSWEASGRRGLNPTQAQVLALIRARGAGLSVKEIAAGLGVTAATASDSVSALERKGLVGKEPCPEDGRVVRIALTAKGRREAEAGASWPELLLEAAGELTEPERAALVRGLVKMIRSLQERGLIPVGRMCVECVHFRPHAHPGEDRPHHCALVDAPLGDGGLRIDCVDQTRAEPPARERLWQVFVKGNPVGS